MKLGFARKGVECKAAKLNEAQKPAAGRRPPPPVYAGAPAAQVHPGVGRSGVVGRT